MKDFHPFGIDREAGIESLDRKSLAVQLRSVPEPIEGFEEVEVLWNEDFGIICISSKSETFEQDSKCIKSFRLFSSMRNKFQKKYGNPSPTSNALEYYPDEDLWSVLISGRGRQFCFWIERSETETQCQIFLGLEALPGGESRVKMNFSYHPPELPE